MSPNYQKSRHTLRFSGIDPQVLDQLKTQNLKLDSQSLFKEDLDVFVKRDPYSGGTVVLVSNENARSLDYSKGIIRHLHRLLTGKDILPTEEINKQTSGWLQEIV